MSDIPCKTCNGCESTKNCPLTANIGLAGLELVFEGEDSRGKVWSFMIGDIEYILFYTKKGYMRGGDYHSAKQYNTVLQGKILFITKKLGMEFPNTYEDGQSVTTEKNIPHYMLSLTDSWMLEWHQLPKTRKIYEPFRKIVEENKNQK